MGLAGRLWLLRKWRGNPLPPRRCEAMGLDFELEFQRGCWEKGQARRGGGVISPRDGDIPVSVMLSAFLSQGIFWECTLPSYEKEHCTISSSLWEAVALVKMLPGLCKPSVSGG